MSAILYRVDALRRQDSLAVDRLLGAVAAADPELLEQLLDRYEAELELERQEA